MGINLVEFAGVLTAIGNAVATVQDAAAGSSGVATFDALLKQMRGG